ncbi:MAG: beta-N-acetylhexosaminidase [Candidatus Dadabacteria bacterium]|nr:MAG: beta-N-acetylhexosaminidase [Candidatus Dadabacteria bacterium]
MSPYSGGRCLLNTDWTYKTTPPLPRAARAIVAADEDLDAGAYRLRVDPGSIVVSCNDDDGCSAALATLRQLLGPPAAIGEVVVAAVEIDDVPRFAWRGVMIDVARHFIPLDDLLRWLDVFALHKLNRLHLHLTDDQGWRIEIRARPSLTQIGGSTAVGGGPSGFYTQNEYAQLVSAAAARGIVVVPEIDMPGHIHAALASMPELNCDGIAPEPFTGTTVGFSSLCLDKAETWAFVEDVVGEIAALTPGPFLHIGGDEAHEVEAADYAAFITRAQQIVARNGKRMIGWEEVAAAPVSGATVVQQWLGLSNADELPPGAEVILSPVLHAYLDARQDAASDLGALYNGITDLRRAYAWDPEQIISGLDPARILGVEAPLWTEYVPDAAVAEQQIWPRLIALAEVAWTGQERRDYADFVTRLAAQQPWLDAANIHFFRSEEMPWTP